uniref:MSP domain-containing protein n=1 Tax=Chromera velia CCMP2878 TaxID=1169474 RepID=A0A0G4F007_9ALVE|eukprot:Cvel_14330.t1-p1 / transcript=Cvel_14330.t1 / gene=Cvel_14330 / organism=Chromera_velia_CCMP2878 / gene_product=hypothetical protein / transcript_product=hypothetical protein / location=Cvel_scaffold1014:43887-47252(+) / protein_length=878 / sequence_SO=supercontig / SO=protein_coding / is_pseudo=false
MGQQQSSSEPRKLVELRPSKNLFFAYDLGEEVECELQIKNKKDCPVKFKISSEDKDGDKDLFSFQPAESCLLPNSKVTVSVKCKPQTAPDEEGNTVTVEVTTSPRTEGEEPETEELELEVTFMKKGNLAERFDSAEAEVQARYTTLHLEDDAANIYAASLVRAKSNAITFGELTPPRIFLFVLLVSIVQVFALATLDPRFLNMDENFQFAYWNWISYVPFGELPGIVFEEATQLSQDAYLDFIFRFIAVTLLFVRLCQELQSHLRGLLVLDREERKKWSVRIVVRIWGCIIYPFLLFSVGVAQIMLADAKHVILSSLTVAFIAGIDNLLVNGLRLHSGEDAVKAMLEVTCIPGVHIESAKTEMERGSDSSVSSADAERSETTLMTKTRAERILEDLRDDEPDIRLSALLGILDFEEICDNIPAVTAGFTEEQKKAYKSSWRTYGDPYEKSDVPPTQYEAALRYGAYLAKQKLFEKIAERVKKIRSDSLATTKLTACFLLAVAITPFVFTVFDWCGVDIPSETARSGYDEVDILTFFMVFSASMSVLPISQKAKAVAEELVESYEDREEEMTCCEKIKWVSDQTLNLALMPFLLIPLICPLILAAAILSANTLVTEVTAWVLLLFLDYVAVQILGDGLGEVFGEKDVESQTESGLDLIPLAFHFVIVHLVLVLLYIGALGHSRHFDVSRGEERLTVEKQWGKLTGVLCVTGLTLGALLLRLLVECCSRSGKSTSKIDQQREEGDREESLISDLDDEEDEGTKGCTAKGFFDALPHSILTVLLAPIWPLAFLILCCTEVVICLCVCTGCQKKKESEDSDSSISSLEDESEEEEETELMESGMSKGSAEGRQDSAGVVSGSANGGEMGEKAPLLSTGSGGA